VHSMPRKDKQLLRIKYYNYFEKDYGPVRIGLLKVDREEDAVGDPLEVLAEISERYRNDKNVVVEIQVVEEGARSRRRGRDEVVYTTKYPSILTYSRIEGKLLYPEIARLREIVIIRKSGDPSFTAKIDSLEKYSVRRSYYVYIGNLLFREDSVEGVMLVTDKGVRTIHRG